MDRLNFDQFRSSGIARLPWDTMLLYPSLCIFCSFIRLFLAKMSWDTWDTFFVYYLYIDR